MCDARFCVVSRRKRRRQSMVPAPCLCGAGMLRSATIKALRESDMAEPLRFDDGAAYERMMGTWSRIAGLVFLDWIAPKSGLSWVDIGCGNGAFTESIIEHC